MRARMGVTVVSKTWKSRGRVRRFIGGGFWCSRTGPSTCYSVSFISRNELGLMTTTSMGGFQILFKTGRDSGDCTLVNALASSRKESSGLIIVGPERDLDGPSKLFDYFLSLQTFSIPLQLMYVTGGFIQYLTN
ncbi:hypothetical protein EZV62_001964 [Acer yangbiense]|uniref:Uncharacterized protein n=1 Tax=Acer yangbiense TaxID=1000413 RepID=A0A5C7IVZ6_9ROSI|nr:hypothetical protein EZV62_001964 [Acer yangbiense]